MPPAGGGDRPRPPARRLRRALRAAPRRDDRPAGTCELLWADRRAHRFVQRPHVRETGATRRASTHSTDDPPDCPAGSAWRLAAWHAHAVAASIPYDAIAADYDRTRGGLDRGRDFASTIVPHLRPSTGPVLDLGVGTAAVALPLRDLAGRPVIGVDLSAPMLALAKDRLGEVVVRGDARRLPIASSSTDAVVVSWILHVTGDPAAVMVEVARVLRRGGRAVLFEGRGVEDDRSGLAAIYERVELAGGREPGEERVEIARRAALDAGLVPFVDVLTPLRTWQQSPAELADNLSRRLAGFLQVLPDDRFEEVVGPAVEELLAMPDPDRARTRVNRHRCLVFERPT